jgi:hypothetical protein
VIIWTAATQQGKVHNQGESRIRGWPLNCDVLPLNIKGALRFLRKWPPATLDIEPPEALWPETKGQAASLARVRGHPLHGAAGHQGNPRAAGQRRRARPQAACPLRARSAGQHREIMVTPGQPDTSADLRTGRLTHCANRPSKQRVRLLVGRGGRIRSGCGRTLGFRRAGRGAPSLGKAGTRPCPQPPPARRSPASSWHLSAGPPAACRPLGITMAPLAGLRAARRTLFCTARFDRSLAACRDRAS